MVTELSPDWNLIRTEWADGDYAFRLDWPQLLELEQQRQAGPMTILGRLSGAPWSPMDVREVIRLSLIGGGLEPGKALRLVRTYVERRPLLENLDLAFRILGIAINGRPREAEPNGAAETEPPPGN